MENRFLQLTAEELACDAAFIDLVKEDAMNISLSQWIEVNPDQKDKFRIARQLVLLTYNEVEGIDKKGLWNRIEHSISKSKESQAQEPDTEETTSIMRSLKWASMAAAVIALFLIARPIFMQSGPTVIQTIAQANITLPDQSLVTLNTDSRLTYNKGDWSNNRTLTLKGEAFFSVEKGQKFTVETAAGTVEVLGTSFNVFQRGEVFTVECETGKVKVTHRTSGKEFTLIPGDAVRLDREGTRTIKNIDTPLNRSKWRAGQYNYRDQSLRQVFDEMERQFDIQINADAEISNMKYTGYFEVGALDKAMESVLYPMRLKYSRSGSKILIMKE